MELEVLSNDVIASEGTTAEVNGSIGGARFSQLLINSNADSVTFGFACSKFPSLTGQMSITFSPCRQGWIPKERDPESHSPVISPSCQSV